jgi:hypothetical protein
MKSFKFLMLFFVVAISCDVDNSDDVATPTDPVNENNTVQAQISGVDFASTDSNTFAQITNGTTLRIVGGDGNAVLEILVQGYTGTGLYSLDAGDPNIDLTATYTIASEVGAPDRVWNIVSDNTSPGQVTITEASDAFVSGTFTFTLVNESEDSSLVFSGGNLTVEVQ